MSISPIGGAGATAFVPPSISSGGAGSAGATGASAFAQKLDAVTSLTDRADTMATGVATGNLTDVHQFSTAAAKAQLGVELTVSLRNKAVEAYQDIMRMQV